MASSCVPKVFILIFMASLLGMSGEAKSIMVGGSEGWHFGVNYTDWAIQNSPFFINDKLVFKYDISSDPAYAYNVYMLPSLKSYLDCDFSNGTLLANTSQGSRDGFEVELSQWKPYYFASYGKDGYHCNDGLMRLVAIPWPHLA